MQKIKRQYPRSEGWEYLTLEGIPPGRTKRQILKSLTNNLPELYELAFYKRSRKGMAWIIIRIKPVKNEKTI